MVEEKKLSQVRLLHFHGAFECSCFEIVGKKQTGIRKKETNKQKSLLKVNSSWYASRESW